MRWSSVSTMASALFAAILTCSSGQAQESPGGAAPGDQYVLLAIVLPPDSPAARDFFTRMKRELPFDPRAELAASGRASA